MNRGRGETTKIRGNFETWLSPVTLCDFENRFCIHLVLNWKGIESLICKRG